MALVWALNNTRSGKDPLPAEVKVEVVKDSLVPSKQRGEQLC